MARTESNEAILMRKKARQRLIGAVVLVILAVILLPLVLDRQPQPLSSNVVITMPQSADANRSASGTSEAAGRPVDPGYAIQPQAQQAETALPAPVPLSSQPAPAAAPAVSQQGQNTQQNPTTDHPSPVLSSLSEPPLKASPEKVKPKEKEPEKQAPPPEKPTSPAPTVTEKPQQTSPPAEQAASSNGAKFFIQLGTFSNPENAAKLVTKVNNMGLKAYTENVSANQSTTTRVRVGPFATKEAATSAKSQLESHNIHEGRILQR